MHNAKSKWLNFLFEFNLNLISIIQKKKKKLEIIKKISTMIFYYIEY